MAVDSAISGSMTSIREFGQNRQFKAYHHSPEVYILQPLLGKSRHFFFFVETKLNCMFLVKSDKILCCGAGCLCLVVGFHWSWMT